MDADWRRHAGCDRRCARARRDARQARLGGQARGEGEVMAYEPKLPDGVTLPPGFSIDANSSRYKELHSLAERERWSQSAFSDLLGIEARRVSA
jgi:hypothetical protein